MSGAVLPPAHTTTARNSSEDGVLGILRAHPAPEPSWAVLTILARRFPQMPGSKSTPGKLLLNA